MGELSPEARRAIDAALKRIPPEDRRVPAGVSGEPGYVWDGQKLICREPGRNPYRVFRPGNAQRPGLPHEIRQRIRAGLEAGRSHTEIARACDVSVSSVGRVAAQAGLSIRPRLDRSAVVQAIARGETAAQIAAAQGCSPTSVRRLARREGLVLASGLPKPSQERTGGKPRQEHSAALTERIVALADGTRSLSDIARLAGCDRSAVSLRRDRMGLDIPNGVSGPRRPRGAS